MAICKTCIHEQVCEDFGVDIFEVESCDNYAVRCKDCKFLLRDLSERKHHLCMKNFYSVEVTLDDFCSFGARMDGE